MVIENPVAAVNAAGGANGNGSAAHPSGIPQDKIDNIMSGIANTGDVKMNNHRKKLRQRFDIIKKLGQGTYGKVQLGINKETGQEVAIKTIKKCKIEAEADLVRIRREVQIMSSVQHPNIIHIYEVFENREKMVLVMEFAAGGELYDYLSERKVLSEEEARRIFRQVATAVYYCHKHKICHRDLKLENILLDEHGNAKIADFGLSNVFDDQRLLATFCGSPLYASPEIVEGTPYQGPEVDCWSLGVLLYTLVYGSMPFDGSNFKRLVKQISQGDYYEPKKPSRASTLIRDMLTVCPRKRATIEQICAHWWVNENDNVSCLELAEDLANQTPVRLDVLLSLTPTAITADQLVVPSADGNAVNKGGNVAMPRSHSVGSIRDMTAANQTTEAERRILDMVAAGGEAALMPSPTRTITPAQSPVQTKRKLETTISMENAAAALKKKEKAGNSSFVIGESTMPLAENVPMETEDAIVEEPTPTPATVQHTASSTFSLKDMEVVGDMCQQLMGSNNEKTVPTTATAVTAPPTNDITSTPGNVARQKTVGKLDAVQESPEEKDATKVIKKFVNKHKTADLVSAIGQATQADKKNEMPTNKTPAKTPVPTATTPAPFVRKCSLQDDTTINKFNGERRKSRILETAEKFQQMNAGNNANTTPASAASTATSVTGEKPKKIVIPGVSVGSFKKEFERKASNASSPPQGPTPGERRALEQAAAAAAEAAERESSPTGDMIATVQTSTPTPIESSDSKNSVSSFSLEEARRSMENSIALLRQAQSESNKDKDVDQLCAKTENFGVSENHDRERKLQSARAIIGNAIQPVIRRPQAQPQLPLPQPQPPPPLLPSTTFFGIAGGSGGGGNGNGNNNNNNNYSTVAGSIGSGGRNFGGHNQILRTKAANTQIGSNDGNRNRSGSGGFGLGYGYGIDQEYPIGYIDGSTMKNNMKRDRDEHIGGGISDQMFPQQHTTSNSNSNSQSNSNSNAAAIAAARQNIMKHFAAGLGGWNIQQQYQQQQHQHYNPFLLQNPRQQQTGSIVNNAKAKIFGQQAQKRQQFPSSQQQLPGTFFNASTAPVIVAGAAAETAATASNVVNLNSVPKPFYNARTNPATATSSNWLLKSSPGGTIDPNNGVKTSTASITLKSATLPRRKTAKTEIQLDIKPRIMEQQPTMRFTTEMQHPIADLRSAPPREGPIPFSPVKITPNNRATSLEPKEHIIHIQRPPQMAYSRTTSNTTNRSGSLSRQSTNDSESDTTTTNMSQSTMTASSQPIKKSPREFIIPIAVEGGGFITPREGSIEPSESSHTTSSRSTFNRFNPRPTRRIGSLLSETGVDEGGLQFQKLRTGSINREGDDDGRFTLHRLRSTRPLKKINQDNDSNSSGEEDDDDGFEILTAENLFSTLLQRVRALTNRINVNNDLTSGFPNSSRLLTTMRHGHGPFWNQEPFTRSQMSYTYSETVEKKHVRLNNVGNNMNASGTGIGAGVGAPWRHSMSRDLGSDMESMFSRTGATLPRGSGSKSATKTKRQLSSVEPEIAANAANLDCTDTAASTDEPLDLADLDLSRLRLSKKELETLSSIAPGLPKCFQEQLLAKLPPTQARKLSRTLSMQNSPQTPSVKVYKRSQSGGRPALSEVQTNLPERCEALPEESEISSASPNDHTTKNSENKTELPTGVQTLHRRSLSRSRYDYESGIPSVGDTSSDSKSTRKSRSNSVCRDDYSKSLCSAYTSDISDKYKYYSPYLSKSTRETTSSSNESGPIAPYKRFNSVSPRESTVGAVSGRPPSGCLSPPPAISGEAGNSSSLRRRAPQRRISRFLRPDFFEEQQPNIGEETAYQREKRNREREAQNVLREIREKSREPSRERVLDYNESETKREKERDRDRDQNRERISLRKHSLTGTEAELLEPKTNHRHVRNKSMELYGESSASPLSPTRESPSRNHRRSLSRPRNVSEDLDTHALADKILEELQLLSAMRSEQNKQRLSVPREMSLERTTETNTVGLNAQNETVAEQKTVTVKKVKKVKPKEKAFDASGNPVDSKLMTTTVVKKVKKIVKKADSGVPQAPLTELPPMGDLEAQQAANEAAKESKLKRPKSYPTKELTPKTDIPTSSKIALNPPPVIPEGSCDLATCPQAQQCADANPRESRLMRPKSYPASKLTAPKELKKIVTRSGAAIPSIAESNTSPQNERQSTSEDKSQSVTPTGKVSADTSSSSESRPTIKRIIKITKKSKLAQPTALTPTTPTTTDTTPTGEVVPKDWKETSPEKKPSKGLLYAIGLKFERLRDSAMNKDKKAALNTSSSGATVTNITIKPVVDSSVPLKLEKKIIILKKKKSMDGPATTPTTKTEKTAKNIVSDEQKTTMPNGDCEKPAKIEKRSRFDAMMRSLRERSITRTNPTTTTESNYIKRAISVEEMPGTSNKTAVNRVLGLFKRFDKDSSVERRVRSTRSTSNLERQMCSSPTPISPIYQNTSEALAAVKTEDLTNSICDCDAVCPGNITPEALTCPDCIAQNQATNSTAKRRDLASLATTKSSEKCIATLSTKLLPNSAEASKQGNKDKRKGLMLDLVKIDNVPTYATNGINTGHSGNNATTRGSKASYINGNGTAIGNGIYSNLPPYPGTMINSSSNHSSSQQSMDNATNNNSCMTNNNNNSSSMHTSQTSGYRTSSTHEINRNNLLTPSTENIANYSSDCSRSYQDDCASTSTFLSPTEEPELYFDNWSICSEDNYMLHASPSPTVSRLSRASQLSSPTRGASGGGGGGDSSDPNESVIDRIKRRSFYCRFNEKKPKRTSSIVGPSAVRDYYREQKAAMKATRSSNKLNTESSNGGIDRIDRTDRIDRKKSPDITQEFLRPLKLSPVGTELKPPVYKSPYSDYTSNTSSLIKPRKSLNDIRTSSSPSYLASKHRYGTTTDHHPHDYLSVPSAIGTSTSRYKSSTSSSPYDTGNTHTGTTPAGTSSSYYSTYNPKRRSSYTLNGILPTGSSTGTSNIDSYATLGRRSIRPYDQRTMSLLDPSSTSTSSYRREARTPVRDYTTPSISRSNSRYRTTSASRSPTNI